MHIASTGDQSARLGSMARPGADGGFGVEDGVVTDIAKLLREAAETLDAANFAFMRSGLIEQLEAAAAKLESAEPFGHVFHDFNGEPYFVDPCDPEYGEGFDVYRYPPSAVPEGWKLVPVEPTPEMLSGLVGPAGYCSMPLADAYKAMLAAAPGAGGGE